MYAAGHPPLPSFEATTFSDAEPRHWQYLREKTADQQKRLQPVVEKNREQAELVIVSGLVAFRESMKLLSREASANHNDPPGAAWPDFARYDCRACHHELRSTLRTESRRARVAPGRPGELEWPQALVPIGIKQVSGDSKKALEEQTRYESLLRKFHEALGARPYGDPRRTIEAADDLVCWANGLLIGDKRSPVDDAQARAMVAGLCELAENDEAGYDVARQCVWAFRAIYHELVPEPARDAKIEADLRSLDGLLSLTLPNAGEQVSIETSLALAWRDRQL